MIGVSLRVSDNKVVATISGRAPYVHSMIKVMHMMRAPHVESDFARAAIAAAFIACLVNEHQLDRALEECVSDLRHHLETETRDVTIAVTTIALTTIALLAACSRSSGNDWLHHYIIRLMHRFYSFHDDRHRDHSHTRRVIRSLLRAAPFTASGQAESLLTSILHGDHGETLEALRSRLALPPVDEAMLVPVMVPDLSLQQLCVRALLHCSLDQAVRLVVVRSRTMWPRDAVGPEVMHGFCARLRSWLLEARGCREEPERALLHTALLAVDMFGCHLQLLTAAEEELATNLRNTRSQLLDYLVGCLDALIPEGRFKRQRVLTIAEVEAAEAALESAMKVPEAAEVSSKETSSNETSSLSKEARSSEAWKVNCQLRCKRACEVASASTATLLIPEIVDGIQLHASTVAALNERRVEQNAFDSLFECDSDLLLSTLDASLRQDAIALAREGLTVQFPPQPHENEAQPLAGKWHCALTPPSGCTGLRYMVQHCAAIHDGRVRSSLSLQPQPVRFELLLTSSVLRGHAPRVRFDPGCPYTRNNPLVHAKTGLLSPLALEHLHMFVQAGVASLPSADTVVDFVEHLLTCTSSRMLAPGLVERCAVNEAACWLYAHSPPQPPAKQVHRL